MLASAAKLALLLFAAVLLQVAVFALLEIAGGSPNLVLVALLVSALLLGSILGAVGGFWAGFLLDVAMLGTLGFTSLLYSAGEIVLRFVIGEPAPADVAARALPGALILNLLLTAPVYWFCRKLFERPDRARAREAALYG
jgi:hypothetical protein